MQHNSCSYLAHVHVQLKVYVKETNMYLDYETEKITRKARNPAIIAGRTTKQHIIIAVFLLYPWLQSDFLGQNKQHVIIIIMCCSVVSPKKITCKASAVAENLQL